MHAICVRTYKQRDEKKSSTIVSHKNSSTIMEIMEISTQLWIISWRRIFKELYPVPILMDVDKGVYISKLLTEQ